MRSSIAYIAPGDANIEVCSTPTELRVKLVSKFSGRDKVRGSRITPSADHLFYSLAQLFEERFCALVLTGMGFDGAAGVKFAHQLGGYVIAESPRTAAMPGMPNAAIRTGVVDEVLPLHAIPLALNRFAKKCGKP